jgi:phospholipase C
MRQVFVFGALFALSLVVFAGCSVNRADRAALPALTSVRPLSTKYSQIQHVVVVVQENRSVDNLFQGFPGAETRSYGYDTEGTKITLQPVPLQANWGIAHGASVFFLECDGTGKKHPGTDCRMDGFDQEAVGCGHASQPKCPNANPPYSYVPHSQTKPYFSIGENYSFADEMFQSDFDESSFVSHLYLIAAQDPDQAYDWPDGRWGCDSHSRSTDTKDTSAVKVFGKNRKLLQKTVWPCFDVNSVAGELDQAGLSWRYYAAAEPTPGAEWEAYQAIKPIYEGSDFVNDVITPESQFFTDVSKGKLANVTWITPQCTESDHAGPPCSNDKGPSWVASVVNAVGESKFWDSTLMFIMWDDPGGWYDHVGPKYVDFDGLGLRIPLLVVSPYSVKGCVSHVPYENGSIPHFIEYQWGLKPLAQSDTRSNIPTKCLDFSQKPRSFTKVPAPYDEGYFMREPPDSRPPDDDL